MSGALEGELRAIIREEVAAALAPLVEVLREGRKPAADADALLGAAEVATITGTAPSTARAWMAGPLAPWTVSLPAAGRSAGKRALRRISRRDLDRWLASRREVQP